MGCPLRRTERRRLWSSPGWRFPVSKTYLHPGNATWYPNGAPTIIMQTTQPATLILLAAAVLSPASSLKAAELEPGFTALFDGQSLNGWKLVDKQGAGYGVKDGVIY